MNNIGDDIAQAFDDGYEAGKRDSFAEIKELQAEIKTIQGRYDALKVFTDEAQRQMESLKPKHGEWILQASGQDCKCSACGAYWIPFGDEYDYKFCPNCGADMRKMEVQDADS